MDTDDIICWSCGHNALPQNIRRRLTLLGVYCDNCYLRVSGEHEASVPKFEQARTWIEDDSFDMDEAREFYMDCREDALRALEDTTWMEDV